jgi:hypothetical protein
VARVALSDIPSLPKIEEPFRQLLRSAVGSLEVSEQAVLRISVRCRDDSVARDIKEIGEGGAALLKLLLAKKPELQKMFAGALAAARFEQAGADVNAEARMEAAGAASSVAALIAIEERRRRGFGAASEHVGAPEKGDF